MQQGRDRSVSRRRFLVQGAAATAAVAAGQRLAFAAEKPQVVIVRDQSEKVVQGRKVDAALTRKLVDQAVMTMAGKDDVGQAWGAFVKPSDKVAVKFNGLFRGATTHPDVVDAVTRGLMAAGVDPAHIVIYDRDAKAFRTARIPVNRDDKSKPLAFPTEKAYGPKVKAGPHTTQLSKILAQADALINLPVLKTHGLAGASGALKNHLGTIPNAWELHPDDQGGKSCLYVADLNAMPDIKAKTRLCIVDGLYGLYHGGPQFNPRFRWDYCGVLAATDPVALDITLSEILKAKRTEKGMGPYHKPIRHIHRAAELDLGVGDPKAIQRVEKMV
ncbi:MAG: DUF362 domain-containing protein [Planctomycetota bacterium]